MKGINYIKKGCIDTYYALKVDTKITYVEMCNIIRKQIDSTRYRFNEQVEAKLKEDIEKSISESNFEEIKNIKLKTNYEHKVKKKGEMCSKDFSQSISGISVEFTENGFKFSPKLELDEEMNEYEEIQQSDYNTCSRIYGKTFVDNCQRFYLPPLKVQLINNEMVYLKLVLYVFKNKMMILRISIPIQNVETTMLIENNLDGYIKNIIDELDIGIDGQSKSIEDIKNVYLRYIKNSSKKITNIAFASTALTNIILADFEDMLDNIRVIPDAIAEDLYKISVAPIEKRHQDAFKGIAKEYISNNSQVYDGIAYIVNSMGKCISIIDRTMIEYLKEDKAIEDENISKEIVNSLQINVEFAFIILLLRKMNAGYTYLQKEIKEKNFDKAQKEYHINNIFILQLQQCAYGSVKEQIDFLEEKMYYFVATKDMQEKMKSMDYIIKENREKKKKRFQNFLAIVGVLLTTILGLPTIHETLTILKKTICANIDIPIINIENSSIALWIILLMFLIVKVIINRTK